MNELEPELERAYRDRARRQQNIITIQQKQVERLLDARNAEQMKVSCLEMKVSRLKSLCNDWERLVDDIFTNCSVSEEHVNRASLLRSLKK